jgi:hypothetical protein
LLSLDASHDRSAEVVVVASTARFVGADGGVSSLTVTETVSPAVAPSSSVTVSETV